MKKNLTLNEVTKILSIQDMILQSASKFGMKMALEDLNDTPIMSITYKQLFDNILRFGTALKELGVNERSHVAIICENIVQLAIGFLTAMCFN